HMGFSSWSTLAEYLRLVCSLEHGLNSCGAWALLLHGMWNPPGPGIEPMCPALADVSCKAVASENWAPCVHDRERSIQKKMESTQGLFPVPEEHLRPVSIASMQFSSLSSDMPQELAATQAPVPSEMRQASVFLLMMHRVNACQNHHEAFGYAFVTSDIDRVTVKSSVYFEEAWSIRIILIFMKF
ncbi:hypothetical protein MG293_003482, partial [Ovis ammon polii]